jgi:hypothetical protein
MSGHVMVHALSHTTSLMLPCQAIACSAGCMRAACRSADTHCWPNPHTSTAGQGPQGTHCSFLGCIRLSRCKVLRHCQSEGVSTQLPGQLGKKDAADASCATSWCLVMSAACHTGQQQDAAHMSQRKDSMLSCERRQPGCVSQPLWLGHIIYQCISRTISAVGFSWVTPVVTWICLH